VPLTLATKLVVLGGGGGEAVERRGVCMLVPALWLTMSCGHTPRPLWLAGLPTVTGPFQLTFCPALPLGHPVSLNAAQETPMILLGMFLLPKAHYCPCSPGLVPFAMTPQAWLGLWTSVKARGGGQKNWGSTTYTEKGVLDLGSSRP